MGQPRVLFGRRKGHRLRAAQADRLESILSRLELTALDACRDPAALFARPVTAIRLEIGFGGGEHLAARASAHPDIGFIGCEPFLNGMAKLAGLIEAGGLDNIRLYQGDGGDIVDALPDRALSQIDLLYPDPWPKRRHRKRRLVSDAMVQRFARLLPPGGRFCFASDIDDYVGWTLARVLRSPAFRWLAEGPDDWRKPFPGWPGTRYEAKALRAGRAPSYLTFERV